MRRIIPFSLTLILVFCLALFGFRQYSNAASAPKYFVYVVNSGSNNISAYSLNPNTGELNKVKGSPFTTGNSPCSITVHPNGKFIYVANYQSHSITAYSIDPATGALKVIKGIHSTKETPFLISMAPSGKFIYVANVGDGISIYRVNVLTGALSPVKGNPFRIQESISSLTIDPSGKLAFIPNYDRNSVMVYSTNTNTGKFTKISETPISSGTDPKSVAIDPTGKFAFVPNYESQNFSVYKINKTKGVLTEIKGSPYGADHPTQVTFALSGKVAYILNSETIEAYFVNPTTGLLTEFKNNPLYHTMDNPTSFITDPTNKFLYVTNKDSNTITAFLINSSTGALTEIKGSPFKAGTRPVSIISVKL